MAQTVLTEAHWLADPGTRILDSTIASILRDAAAEVPDQLALVAHGDVEVRATYAEVLRDAEAVARALGRRCAPGDRLAVLAPSISEFYVLSFAAALARLVLVPMNPLLRPAEIQHILARSGAVAAFFVADHRGNELERTLRELQPALPSLRDLLPFTAWSELIGEGADASGAELTDPAPDDLAQLVFTSGTTGAPKGVMLTHQGMTNASRLGGARFGIARGDVYVNTIPLYHVGGQGVTFQIVQARASSVLLRQFDPGVQLELLERERATHTVGVPTMLQAVIEHPDFARRDLSTLRTISSGGALVPVEMIENLRQSLGVQTTIVFGQTEACGFISQTHLDDAPEDTSSTIGQLLPHLEGRVVDPETGATRAPGEVGELQVRGPGLMVGYFDDPEQTASAFADDEWLRTGDLVTMDDRGYLKVTGRAKDMIVTGGINVYPAELEAVLGAHPAVGEIAVVAVPDPRWGEAVVAVVRVRAGAEVTAEHLDAFGRERLAPYKVPKRWVFVDEMPLTASGKIQKFVLRDQLVDGQL